MLTVGSIVAWALWTARVRPARTVNSAAKRRRGVMELLESDGRRAVPAASGDHGPQNGDAHQQQHDRDHQRGDHGPLAVVAGRARGKIGRAHVLNSSHVEISYAVFCLKKKNN